MHWKRENVNAMLALRNAVCNDRWAAAWAASYTCHQQQRHQRRYNRTRASVQPRFLPVPAALVAFLSATRTDDDGSCLASVSGNNHLNCTPGGFAAAASCCHPSLEASFQQPFEESCPCKTLNPTRMNLCRILPSAHYKIRAFYGINEFVKPFSLPSYRMSIDVHSFKCSAFSKCVHSTM